tara:strand:- start:816 stop:1475 length:660 start_codon:yes stop_codon:yes gene_type:complete
MPEIKPGDDISELILKSIKLTSGDVIVITQKIISKAEDRLVDFEPEIGHKPIVESESKRILRRRGDLIISETTHGFICANAGVDLSNVTKGTAALLPIDPDKSANRIRMSLKKSLNINIAVIITDTFGRPWRRGVTDVAIGCSGIKPIIDLRGSLDALGQELQVTEVAIVDEIAAAAELVMGKSEEIPAAIVRGVNASHFGDGEVVRDVVRNYNEDLFR